MCVWNLEKQKVYTNQNPEKYAAQGYFYDASQKDLDRAFREMMIAHPQYASRINTSDEQLIEKYLSRSESDASIIIDQICSNHKEFYRKAKAKSSAQMTRNKTSLPSQREGQKEC